MIDINCDMGEIQDLLDNNVYSDLMDHVTSINLACGGHAGDETMMRNLIRTAHRKDVNVVPIPAILTERILAGWRWIWTLKNWWNLFQARCRT